LTEKGYFIYSRISFLVHEVIRNKTSVEIKPEQRIIVLQPGGVMRVAERQVTAVDPQFALFQVGSKYVLFLQSIDEAFTFEATPRGSFELKNDEVLPATGTTIHLPEMKDPGLFVQAARDAAASCIDEK
jgi:hypothetical protein